MTENHQTFILVATGVFLSTLDSSMTNVALPAIMADMDVELALVDLVVIVYLMVITCSLLIWGRLADFLNKRKLYLLGVTFFALSALACTTASTIAQLILFRGGQGMGAAMMMAVGPALIREAFENDNLGSTYGLIGIATSLGLMLGPVVSGILISAYGWQALFFFPLPFSVFILLFGYKLSRTAPPPVTSAFTWSILDVAGAMIWILFIVSLVVGLKTLNEIPLLALCSVGFSISLLCLFCRYESRRQNPLIPIKLFGASYYRNAVISAFLSFCVLFLVIVLTPFYLDLIQGYSSIEIGKTMMALPVTLIVFSPLSGWLYDRYGSAEIISTIGLVCCGLAVTLMLRLDDTSNQIFIVCCLALLGSGQSLFLTPNSSSVLKIVPQDESGVTSGILATARNFGMMWGAAIVGTAFAIVYGLFNINMTGEGELDTLTFLFCQRVILGIGLVLTLIGCYFSMTRHEGNSEIRMKG